MVNWTEELFLWINLGKPLDFFEYEVLDDLHDDFAVDVDARRVEEDLVVRHHAQHEVGEVRPTLDVEALPVHVYSVEVEAWLDWADFPGSTIFVEAEVLRVHQCVVKIEYEDQLALLK